MPCSHGLCRFQNFSVTVRISVTAGILLTAGCMQIPRAPLTPPHWSGSGYAPSVSPLPSSSQPVPEDVPAPVPDDGPQPTFGEDYSAPTPVQSNRNAPTEASPNQAENSVNPNVQPPRLEAPSITPEGVTVPLMLDLKIEAPETNLVGEVSVFEISLQNPSDYDAEDVVIESRFEEGLLFPGSTDQQVNQTIGTLLAGETRQVKLSLKSHRAGYHCVEFRLLAKGTEPLTKKVCVKYQDAAVSLQAEGPAKRMVGGNAEWNLTVLSREFLPVPDAVVTVDYDSTYLKPVGGSEGAKQELGKITWPLGTLQSSERVELQVEFECLMPVDSTCLSIKVRADGGHEQTAQSCLAIDRRVGALEIDLKDSPDPVKIGGEVEYVVTIANRGLESVHDLQATASLPEMLRASSTEVREDRQPLSGIQGRVDGSLVRFDSVDVLAPDAELTFTIKAKALRPGTERLLLSVSSDDRSAGKIRLEEVTTIVQ